MEKNYLKIMNDLYSNSIKKKLNYKNYIDSMKIKNNSILEFSDSDVLFHKY